MSRIEQARKELNDTLHEHDLGNLMDLIEEYIDAKLDEKIDDLRNEINKTGTWSPDY